jgi:hypothetical protein
LQDSELDEGKRRVRVERNHSLGLEVAHDVDGTDARGDDHIAGKDGDVRLGTAHRVCTDVDYDGFGESWPVDRDDMTDRARDTARLGEDLQQMEGTAFDGHHAMRLTEDGDELAWAVFDPDHNLRVAVHAHGNQLFSDERPCLVHREACEVDAPQERKLGAAISVDTCSCVVSYVSIQSHFK